MPSTSQAALSTTHSTTAAALFIAALSPGSFSRDSSSLADRESIPCRSAFWAFFASP